MNKIYKMGFLFHSFCPKISDFPHKLISKVVTEVNLSGDIWLWLMLESVSQYGDTYADMCLSDDLFCNTSLLYSNKTSDHNFFSSKCNIADLKRLKKVLVQHYLVTDCVFW